ncbi:beta-ketoacyl synthase N-terminal-like domain-containing protein [Paenibacillus sp. NPDC057934]|uniref:beta-ketoacyl synthase N-terminal-like domain-containing protein n=1 Tax=Paenibacillus sp. NPDC057934 TaxID=3346282 RepID=UPI0036D8653B
MNQWLAKLLWGQLHTMGLLTENSADKVFLEDKGLKDLYHKWFEESISMLERHPLQGLRPSRIEEVWSEWERNKPFLMQNENLSAQIVLAETTLRALPNILTSKVPATDVMFPKGTMKLVEGIYKNNLVADYFNEVLSNTVINLIEGWLRKDKGRQIRILEIGAGTGGTSSMLLGKLKAFEQEIEEYCYTDISKAFLKHGEIHYGEQYPFLTFNVLNIEEPVGKQGIEVGGYDLVVAANVLHATKNIRQTIRNAKSILRNKGVLLLNELTDSTLFTHLTFGLLDGWWKYEDNSYRIPGCPGLYPQQWKKVLEMEGYEGIGFPAEDMAVYGQQIITAFSDGIVQTYQPGKAGWPLAHEKRDNLYQRHGGTASPIREEAKSGEQIWFVKQTILENISETLRINLQLIDHDSSFADFGVDSITGVQMVQSINRKLRITLDSTDLFDYSSVNQLAAFIMERHKDALTGLSIADGEARRPSLALPERKQVATATGMNPSHAWGRNSSMDENRWNSRGDKLPDPILDSKVSLANVKDILLQKVSYYLRVPLDMIDPDDAFSDYGVDSVTGVQLVQSINKALQIELENTDLFDYNTVNQLAAQIQFLHRKTQNDAFLNKSEKLDKVVPSYFESVAREPEIPLASPLGQEKGGFADLQPSRIPHSGKNAKEIAIIGMSGRFAMANNVNELWERLANGEDLIEEVKRWDLSTYNPPGKAYCNYGGFIGNMEQFDPLFFNITGLEGTYMDPQQRIFLEEAWTALEDAGYAGPAMKSKSCGVYVGCGPSDYVKLLDEQQPAQAFWGNASSIIPARIAYYLDLQGPAIAVDTACSSSLAAIHLACQGLWTGETEMALAGGIFLQATPDFYISAGRAGMLSHKGRCFAFDHRADGFVPGEGAGVVILKRLEDALNDGDHIYGVIRGTAMNQDGSTNGITAPSALSQERLQQTVYDSFGIHPEEIQILEAHGTGTQLGDPIEFKALSRSFTKYTDKTNYCALGTIKSNVGHTQYASGVAGLIKILLSLQYKQILPSLQFEKENANIQLKGSPFYINQHLKPWSVPSDIKRKAAISSFGFSGTNVHMVIEEAPEFKRSHASRPGYVVVLSGRTKDQLRQQVLQLINYCAEKPELDCGNLSFTLFVGRKHFNHRLACVVQYLPELIANLREWLMHESGPSVFSTQNPANDIRQEERERLELYGNECIAKCGEKLRDSAYMEYLAEAAKLYVQGMELEFQGLFPKGEYTRIPLPTYPFGRERYWVSQIKRITNENFDNFSEKAMFKEKNPASEQPTLSYVIKQWERASIESSAKEQRRNVLILASEETELLARHLTRYIPGSDIVYLHDLHSVLQQPERTWEYYSGFIDLIGCGNGISKDMQWLSWLQKLIEYGRREGFMVICVTRGLESYENTNINLAGASRVGLYRMLQSEYSYVRSRHMDGDPAVNDADLAEQIMREFSADNEDTEVCYRGGERYRAFLQEAEEYSRPIILDRKFPSNHVLWITGGTRGLGLLCARHFVKHYGVRQLVLSGKEILPPRDQWDALMDQDTKMARKIRSIREIEREGVEVFVQSINLGDIDSMRASMDSVKRFMGPIGGVIHCAGIADLENLAFIRKSPEAMEQVLHPKLIGLDVMYEIFKNEPLQFFILYSSVSAIIPTLGSSISDYAMGNAYMDYFAEAKSRTCPIISIQWSSWKEEGMGEVFTVPYRHTGMLSMNNEEGLTALDRILALKSRTVVLPALVNPAAWEPGRLMSLRRLKAVNLDWKEAQPSFNSHDYVPKEMSRDGLAQTIQDWLISLFAKELRVDESEFGPDIPFQQYGMDSILLAQVITRMDNELEGIALDPSIILEYPTIRSLVEHLMEMYPEVVRIRLGRSATYSLASDGRFPEGVQSHGLMTEVRLANEQERAAPSSVAVDNLVGKTEAWLISLFSNELRIDPSEIQLDIPFQQYGMDSILLAQVVTRMDLELNNVAIDPSIILEYPILRNLAAYLSQTYEDELRLRLGLNEKHQERIPDESLVQEQLVSTNFGVERVPKAQREEGINCKDKVAIVGIGCQFPDSSNKQEYWNNLKQAKDSIKPAPTNRWDTEKEHPSVRGKKKVGAFLEGIEDFDPAYFQIPESLAVQIDPLQRKVLECGASALADAGYEKEELWNKQVGVFIGARTSSYYQKLGKVDKDTIVGIGQNFIAAHLSHYYNFKGPNMVVDTACSSSLTAIHVAAKSILNGESEMALAGGVDIILDESIYVLLSAANILSPDGKCQAFSAHANGIGVGEGCGIVILKSLEQAILDNDRIYGVIDGSAINNDGNTMGITTPNPEAQRELIEKAIADARIDPSTISYVETHGTGTLIGDPIELKALKNVFSKYTDRQHFCGVGSVKSNIGHSICAAGIASFIKVLLSMVHEELPATLHCDTPNPRFNFEDSPFYIVQEHQKWTCPGVVLRAGISSFGLGGNNAHIIVSNEGIPDTHRASLVPPKNEIPFLRKRYWPEPQRKEELDKEFTAFFEVLEVE